MATPKIVQPTRYKHCVIAPAYQVVKLIRDTLRGELIKTDWKNPQPPLYAHEVGRAA